MKRIIPILFLIITSAFISELQAQSVKAPEEAILDWSYGGCINTPILCMYANDSMYVPLNFILQDLELKYEYNDSSRKYMGKIYRAQLTYTIDFKGNTYNINGHDYTIDHSEFILTEDEVYVTPSLLYKIFNWDFRIYMRTLAAQLKSPYTLPVLETLIRKKRWARQKSNNHQDSNLTIISPIERKLFDGFMMDYQINGSMPNNIPLVGYNVQAGSHILGGNLLTSLMGRYTQNKLSLNNYNAEWKFEFESNPFLRRVSAGNYFVPARVPNPEYYGMRLTNRDNYKNSYFDMQVIEGTTEPGNPVELFVNDEPYEVIEADSSGNYRFETQVQYGKTRFDILQYKAGGEIEAEDYSYFIPMTLNRPGEIIYSLEGGLTKKTKKPVSMASATVGLFQWLSLGSEITYSTDLKEKLLYGVSAQFAPFSTIYGSASYIPNSIFASSVMYNPYKQIVLSLSYDKILGSGIISRSNTNLNMSFGVIPFINLPLNFHINRAISGETEQFNLTYSPTFSLLGIQNRFLYRGRIVDRDFQTMKNSLFWSPQVSMGIPSIPWYFGGAVTNGARISASYNMDVLNKRPMDVAFALSRSFGNIFQLQGIYVKNLGTNGYAFNVNFSSFLDFKVLQTTAHGNYSNSGLNYQLDLAGSMAYSLSTDMVKFQSRGALGVGAILLRLFIDQNDNGVFDEGEPLESSIPYKLGGVATILNTGEILINGLPEYYTVLAKLDEEQMNPSFVPKLDNIGFISEPNRYKRVDIPFYAAGTLEGTVTQSHKGYKKELGGLRLHIIGTSKHYEKTITTFSDGSFFLMGMPPGNYIAVPDSAQLGYLNSVSVPEKLEFTVQTTTEGDFINGVIFEVITRESDSDIPLVAGNSKTPGYYLMVDTYADLEKARTAVKRYSQEFIVPLQIEHDTISNVYIVRSKISKNYSEVQGWWASAYSNNQPQKAAIMYGGEKLSYLFALRITDLATFYEAKKIAVLFKSQYNMNMAIDYNYDKKEYAAVGMPMQSSMLASFISRFATSALKFDTVCVKSFPTSITDYRIEFKSFSKPEEASAYAMKLKKEIGDGLGTGVTFDSKRQEFIVISSPFESQQEADAAVKKLNKSLREKVQVSCGGCQ